MSKRNSKLDRIEVTEVAFNKIMSWGQSLDEVIFLATGLNNKITDAVRLTNISRAPKNYCDYTKKEFNDAVKKIQLRGLEVVCMGHSHPHKNHLRQPSKTDWRYLPKRYYHLIVFPFEYKIRAWEFKKTYEGTISSEIELKTMPL